MLYALVAGWLGGESKQKSGPVESTEPLGVSGPIFRGSKGKPGVVPGFDKWENDVPE